MCNLWSFLVIYVSQDALNIVLNSIALYFIMDVADVMVDYFDYVRIKNWMQNELIFDEWFDDDWYDQHEGNVQFKRICCITMRIRRRRSGCGKFRDCCG